MTIPESDWRRFKNLKRVVLERFCEGVLEECQRILADPGPGAHDRYLRLFRLTRERDRELARAFDGQSRSKAIVQLVAMRRLGLVRDEELHQFTPDTRRAVEGAAREV